MLIIRNSHNQEINIFAVIAVIENNIFRTNITVTENNTDALSSFITNIKTTNANTRIKLL